MRTASGIRAGRRIDAQEPLPGSSPVFNYSVRAMISFMISLVPP